MAEPTDDLLSGTLPATAGRAAGAPAPVAVVIGAGPGIGAAVARRFAAGGHRIGLVARRAESVEAPLAAVRDVGGVADAALADAGDPVALRLALDALAGDGVVDAVICNAVSAPRGLPTALFLDDVLAAFAVNVGMVLTAASWLAEHVAARRPGGPASLLVTGGGLAMTPAAPAAALSMAKAAQRNLVESLDQELGPAGIHAATVIVCGRVQPGGPWDPDHIAEQFAALHAEPAGSWRREIVV
jgi:NAD(P)-dependent dehydrogenase (short-subunit alcohol dehydrogenase family)